MPAKEEQKSETRKKLLQGWNTEKAVLFLWARNDPCDSSPVQKETLRLRKPALCKEGSTGACACASRCASVGGGVWQRRCDDSVGACAFERLR